MPGASRQLVSAQRPAGGVSDYFTEVTSVGRPRPRGHCVTTGTRTPWPTTHLDSGAECGWIYVWTGHPQLFIDRKDTDTNFERSTFVAE